MQRSVSWVLLFKFLPQNETFCFDFCSLIRNGRFCICLIILCIRLGIIARLRRKSSNNRSPSIRHLRYFRRFYLDPLMDFRLANIQLRFNSLNNSSSSNNSNRNLSVAIIIGPSHRPNLNTISSVTRMDRNRGTSGISNCWYVSSQLLSVLFLFCLCCLPFDLLHLRYASGGFRQGVHRNSFFCPQDQRGCSRFIDLTG